MKSVLISTRPNWCEKICHKIGEKSDGTPIYEKSVEVRKTAPKGKPPFKVYIYESGGDSRVGNQNFTVYLKGNGRKNIIGEFVCDNILDFTPDPYEDIEYLISDEDLEASCLTVEELWEYGKGKTLYGWHISDLVIYDKPRELSEFYKKCKATRCEGCEHLKYQGVNSNEYDYDCEYMGYCIPITRPPQSWCYVEEVTGYENVR